MNKKDWVEGLLFAGFRIISTGVILVGLLGLVFQIIDTWYRFDPNYLGSYLADTLLRPFIMILAGVFLHAIASRMSHRMAARFSHS